MKSWDSLAPFALLALLACGTRERAAAPTAVVRDSAGIRIVENTTPLWGEGQGWTVVDSPLVDIGGNAADAAYDLAQVNGVVMLGDGRLVVAVGGAYQVRFYNSDGTHIATAGQRGNGPGEFQGIGGLFSLPGDSVLVSDLIQRRLTVLSDSGKLGRAFSLGGEAGMNMPSGGRFSWAMPAGTFSDGRAMAFSQSFRINDANPGAYRDSADYVVYSSGGVAIDTVGRFPGIEMEQVPYTFGGQTFNAPTPVALGKTTALAIARDRLLIAKNEAWEIEDHSIDGTLVRLIRLRMDPRSITPEDEAANRQVSREFVENQPMLRSMPPQIKQQMLDRVEKAPYPRTLPFIASLQAAPDGTLWVYEQARPGDEQRVYAVLDSTGQFLGRVTFPDRFQPFAVTADRVAGVWKDAEDVEHVRVYAIHKP